jgi:formylglycine-generating enzyme
VTVAEKVPDLVEIMKLNPPGTPPPPKETLVPGSLVFTPPAGKVPLNDVSLWWKWTPGANWRHPDGPGSELQGRDNHPVVHVAYSDALAYCAWRGKKEGGVFRLPTEAEWEFASRGGLDKKPYLWGDELRPHGKPMANTWQGEFPHKNTMEDGYLGAAPVASFPANDFGLHDMAGNVWEWCADWYQPRYASSFGERNPQGPTTSHDPNEPGVPKRVQRGGSYLCCDNYCSRYMAGARGKGEPESTTNHIGFRCLKAVGQPN